MQADSTRSEALLGMSFGVIISGWEDWKGKPPGVKPGDLEWYFRSRLEIYNSPQLKWGRYEPLGRWATTYQHVHGGDQEEGLKKRRIHVFSDSQS